jgi:hypothetical protein
MGMKSYACQRGDDGECGQAFEGCDGNRHRRVWPISVQCRVLQASVAGYHEHFVRAASAAQRRHLSVDALLVHIRAIHAETHGGYGWPRTWKELHCAPG